MENYCTLFHMNYLPLGMALHQSLLRHAGEFRLWILCMDEEVEAALGKLGLPNVRLLPLRDLEALFPSLLAVRPGRSRGEYCWTSTPFLPEAIFRIAPELERVTYVDADVFFFGSPRPILSEFEESKAHVLVTEHGYPADADNSDSAGRFNVQFMPFAHSEKALEILRWWQDRCLQCCTNDSASGSFGDQKYLNEWPELFGDSIHILREVERTLGPWNIRNMWKGGTPKGSYHYSGVRIFQGGETMLYPADHPVVVPWSALRHIYRPYLRELAKAWKTCAEHGLDLGLNPAPRKSLFLLRRLGRMALRIQYWTRIDGSRFSLVGWNPLDA